MERDGGILEGYGLEHQVLRPTSVKTSFQMLKALLKESALGFAGLSFSLRWQQIHGGVEGSWRSDWIQLL